ncbi:MAG: MMPL family transporter [Myxococcota bacterium]
MIRTLLGRARLPYLAALAIATIGLGVLATKVPIEQSNESMDSASPEERALDDRIRAIFGSDADLVMSVSHPQLLGPEGIRLLDELTTRAAAIDGVRRVYSLSNAVELVPGPDGAIDRPLVPRPIGGTEYASRMRQAVTRNPELEGFLVSADLGTAALLIEPELRPGDDAYRPRILAGLRALMEELGRGEAELHLTGLDAQKFEVTRLLARDQAVLIPASVVVLGLLLAFFFRRPSGVAIPLAVTGVTLVWTLGIYGASGYALNTMTSLLPPVLMVLSVSTSVHLYETWLTRSGRDETRLETIESLVRDLRRPCFFTSLTTALGMLSLTVSDTPAVRLFGLFTALGVMISLAVSFTLVPVALSFLTPPAPRPNDREHPLLTRFLQRVAALSMARPGIILAVAFVATVAGGVGISRLRSDTDLVAFLKADSQLRRDSTYIDRHLSGINTLELVLSRRDGASLASADTVARLERFRLALLDHEEVGAVQSVLSLLRAIHRAEAANAGPALPRNQDDVLYAFDLLEAAGDEDLIRRVIDPGFRHARIRTQIHSIGSSEAAPLEERILTEAKEIFGDDYTLEVTGAFHRMAQDSNRLVEKQVESFSLAFVLVILAVGMMFRSVGVMAISIIPNVIPIVWTGGLMGALDIELSTGTTMIASVVIGLAVDDTIHYLTRFRRERWRGVTEAVRITTTGTGRALVISSVVLVTAFWVGALGSFLPTIYFSLLTGITMIGALLCDLLVLPACLLRLAGSGRAGAD